MMNPIARCPVVPRMAPQYASIVRFLVNHIKIRKRNIDERRTPGQRQGMQITRAKAFKKQPDRQSAEAYHPGANVFEFPEVAVKHVRQARPIETMRMAALGHFVGSKVDKSDVIIDSTFMHCPVAQAVGIPLTIEREDAPEVRANKKLCCNARVKIW